MRTLLLLSLVIGCTTRGTSSFESAVPQSGGAGAKDNAAPGTTTQSRAIVEPDLIKLDGAGHLFALNPYRGLQIVDISQPDAPKLLGRAPIFGQPVEMFVVGQRAYVIVSDYFTYWWDTDRARSFHGSQVVVVDLSNLESPVIAGKIDLEGYVTDSRIVGDVLYAVANRYAWYTNDASADTTDLTYVASVDVSDPANVRKVAELDFPGQSWKINVSENAIFVAQPIWDNSDVQTQIQYIDIHDPKGQMAELGSVTVAGDLADRWQMDSSLDGTSFRVVTHAGNWSTGGWQRLSIFDTHGGVFSPVSQLDLPSSGGLFAARFDGTRLYLATQVSVDPLHIVDLSDPKNPVVASSLELPGTLKHLEPRGDRLIALGTSSGTWQGVAVSLFDVTSPSAPKLLGQANVGDQAWSNALYDDKAFQIVDSLGLMLVPFSGPDPMNANSYIDALALVDVNRDSVTARGYLQNLGTVQRAFAVGTTRVMTLSDLALAAADISDRDHPKLTGSLELARNVVAFAAVNGRAVQLVQRGYWNAPTLTLRVLPMQSADEGAPMAELPAGNGWDGGLTVDGDRLYVSAHDYNSNATRVQVVDFSDADHPRARGAVSLSSDVYYGWYGGWNGDGGVLLAAHHRLVFHGWSWDSTQQKSQTMLYVVDASDEDTPAQAASIALPDDWSSGFRARGSEIWFTSYQSVPNTSPPLARYYLERVDVSGAGKLLPRTNIPGNFVDAVDRTLYTVDYRWDDQGNPHNALCKLDFDADNGIAYLQEQREIDAQMSNVLVQSGHAYFTTQNWWWTQNGNNTHVDTTLRALDLATLADTGSSTQSGAFTLRSGAGGKLFLELGGWWWWGGPYLAGDVAAPGIACVDACPYWGGGDGILVYDLTDPSQPAYSNFFRTQGWISDIVVEGQSAYLPSGLYGVQVLTL